ncbi:LOW QUALITY PROTEIN: transcription factor IIIA-like [Amphiura filiformis]|uniref:LOW QUALITY PROTEIN: transcription factor IIIA-like n=1 Tax=Amphiura filiformis TaxID=82378 RepID=UPI003B22437D
MFTCEFEGCSAEFKKNWQLQEHLVKHTGQRPFKCDVDGCDKAFTRKPHLQRHQQTHSGHKGFVCSEEGCGQAFTLKDNLKKHIKRFHAQNKFQIKCDFEGCRKVFTKKQCLKIHQYEHTNIKPFRCDHEGCDASYLLPSRLKRHVKQHKGYKCTEDGCTAIFDKWSQFRKHLADDHITEYECKKCQKIFHKRYKLKAHMKYHRDTKEVFMCPRDKCQFTSLRLNEMDMHIHNYHEGASAFFVCQHEGCTKTFVHKKSKIQHQIVHSPGYIKPQPKPKKKRGLSSILATYPDDATKGPRLLPNPAPNTGHRDPQPETETSQGELITTAANTTSTVCDDIQHKAVSNQHNVDVFMESAQTELPTAADERLEEISMENCFIEETVAHSDIEVGSNVVIANETDKGSEEEDDNSRNMQMASETDNGADDINTLIQSVTKTSSDIVGSTVALASDTETGADDLDSLIRAVTKNRNNTSKGSTFNATSALKDRALVS